MLVRKPDKDYADAFADMVRPKPRKPKKPTSAIDDFGVGLIEIPVSEPGFDWDEWLKKQIQDFDDATKDHNETEDKDDE